ncbi:uncharacterized protein LOC122325220 [Puntigrus tetrazona]|uniref:uncharacterized protein LOC122325220 n=1 Tax=Puntigrus tetrazona TaxID=1606681 RepID=UPI001C890560|nr:uncharacterized protein LOC122325220 [Puntigrus tetrazona]
MGNPDSSLCVVLIHGVPALAACCRLFGFCKGTLLSGQRPDIKEARTAGRCSFGTLLTRSFSMTTAPFICDVEGSEESLRPAESGHQLRHRLCSYTLLLVLVGVLGVLVLALTGGLIWMKLFQDCPEKLWTVGFTGTNTNFTSPRTQKYVIFGSIFTKGDVNNCMNLFQLKQKVNITTSHEIVKKNVTENFFKDDVELREGATLSVLLNCENVIIDEDKSKLFIYQQNS